MDDFQWLGMDDPITECYSARYMAPLVEALIEDAKRQPTSLVISFIDIDDFKRVNAAFGHRVGDLALKDVGRVLKFAYPQGCSIGRVGGDEFVVCSTGVPVTEVAEKADAARRLVKRISNRLIEFPETRFSLSVGIAAYPKDGRSLKDLYAAAERATAKAKRLGGDRVVLS